VSLLLTAAAIAPPLQIPRCCGDYNRVLGHACMNGIFLRLPLSLSLSLSRIVSPPQLLRSLLTTWLAGPQQPANSRRDSPPKSRHHPRLRRLPLSRNPKTFHPNLSLSFFVSVKTSVVRVFGGSAQVLVTCTHAHTLLDAIVIRIGLDCGTNLLLLQISKQNRPKKTFFQRGPSILSRQIDFCLSVLPPLSLVNILQGDLWRFGYLVIPLLPCGLPLLGCLLAWTLVLAPCFFFSCFLGCFLVIQFGRVSSHQLIFP